MNRQSEEYFKAKAKHKADRVASNYGHNKKDKIGMVIVFLLIGLFYALTQLYRTEWLEIVLFGIIPDVLLLTYCIIQYGKASRTP